jgi:hypothetical protein
LITYSLGRSRRLGGLPLATLRRGGRISLRGGLGSGLLVPLALSRLLLVLALSGLLLVLALGSGDNGLRGLGLLLSRGGGAGAARASAALAGAGTAAGGGRGSNAGSTGLDARAAQGSDVGLGVARLVGAKGEGGEEAEEGEDLEGDHGTRVWMGERE